ncbi:MAG: C-GCAxxG-C-C family protein [Planctomycetia bacterium]|nr:C-GCAxxG-C-C family protein [Planctomycetia bacterium]
MMNHEKEAKDLFLNGANCAQAVFGAYCEECGLSRESALKIASGFGGGMARMREVCGAVSGMILAANMIKGYSDLNDKKAKDDHYKRIRHLADSFRQETGSIVCRDLLNLSSGQTDPPVSEERTAVYYKKRPCAELVALAARILAEEIEREEIS